MLNPSELKKKFDKAILTCLEEIICLSTVGDSIRLLTEDSGLTIARRVVELPINLIDPSNNQPRNALYLGSETQRNYVIKLVNESTNYNIELPVNADEGFNIILKYDSRKIISADSGKHSVKRYRKKSKRKSKRKSS